MNSTPHELPTRPRPAPDALSRAHWDGLRAHRFVVQQCRGCGRLRHYPRPVCDRCYRREYNWYTLSGRGTVYSWTICHHAFHLGFKRYVPYTVLTVDLEEGVRAQGRLLDDNNKVLKIGLPVAVDYEDVDAELTVPCFRCVEPSILS